MKRLRERAVKRSAHDRFAALCEATKIVCRGLATGEPLLALPALAGIFAADQCPALDDSKLENSALLLAVFKLAWLREDGSLSRVNWRDMGPEELGSVYESLLELVPQIGKDGRKFARSEEHTSELQSLRHLVCRLLLEKKKKIADKRTQQTRIQTQKITARKLRAV